MAKKIEKISVVIADDQTLFREGIKDLLSGEKGIEVIGEAGDGPEAVRLVKKLNPDIVLMDIKLPKMDGIAATRQIHADCPNTNVLVLSSYEDETHILEAIQAGANGYVSKMLPADELVLALKTLAVQGTIIPQNIIAKMIEGLRQRGSIGDSSGASLTKTEVKVLGLLGNGLSNKEIAAELDCSVKTIKNHLNSIFQKLKVQNRTEAVVKGIESGLISQDT